GIKKPRGGSAREPGVRRIYCRCTAIEKLGESAKLFGPHHAAAVNSMVSAVRPGPNAMAHPRAPADTFSRSMDSSTNMTVGEDMLPKSLNTAREVASVVSLRSNAP